MGQLPANSSSTERLYCLNGLWSSLLAQNHKNQDIHKSDCYDNYHNLDAFEVRCCFKQ